MAAPLRTSDNDPLRVDFIAEGALGLPGRLGLTIAPGKKDRARHWDRDLGADLARLRELGTTLLVSLMHRDEYEYLNIPELLPRAEAAGIATRWFPITDVAAPHLQEMGDFGALVDQIIARLRAGETVVVHCRGGLGRSGLVAASVLAALGHPADRAIALVRAARDGAVEVTAQERWVHAFAASEHAARTRTPSADVVRGCLLGGALGDALGAPIEFDRADAIARKFGATPPRALAFTGAAPAHITDDTQMTLFTAEGMIRAYQRGNARGVCHVPTVVGFALLRWYETQGGARVESASERGWLIGEPRLHARRAPGNTCLGSLARLAGKPGSLPTVDSPPNDSKGCGAVMRSAPIGLIAHDHALAFEYARDTGVITHGHPSGYLSAAYLAAVTCDLAHGASLSAAMARADALLAAERGNEEMRAILARARELAVAGPPTVAAIESLGGGWTGEEALAIAVLCALTYEPAAPDGFQRALWRAATHSGDSDSTAAITGNLLGAMLGAARLPAAWLADLELADVIDRIATDVQVIAITSRVLDHADYPPN